jgi:hypothetical protein
MTESYQNIGKSAEIRSDLFRNIDATISSQKFSVVVGSLNLVNACYH